MTTPCNDPRDLIQRLAEALRSFPVGPSGEVAAYVARRAYTAGADAQLEACVEWLEQQSLCSHRDLIPQLRAAMRPKPPSLKERAMDAYNRLYHPSNSKDFAVIRVALEALPDDH